MSDQVGLLDLLRLRGFDPAFRSKLVRHQDKRYDPHDLLRRGWLDAYQGFQVRPIFDGLDYIVSFVVAGGTHARLVGVYTVLGRRPGPRAYFHRDARMSSGRAARTSTSLSGKAASSLSSIAWSSNGVAVLVRGISTRQTRRLSSC